MQMSDNTVTMKGNENVAHIPYQPLWLLIIRGLQLLLAIIILGLCAASGASYVVAAGAGIGIFSFIWTLIFICYIEITIFWAPTAYNKYVHLVLECLSVVFWLSTFAAVAVLATGYSYGYGYYGYGYKRAAIEARYVDVAGCYKGAAALGAIEWALFVGTLITFGIYLHRQRRSEGEARMVTAPAAQYPAGHVEEHKMQPVVNQQPVDPRYQQQTYQQQMA